MSSTSHGFRLGRRAVLRGAGAAVGLPSLEAMFGPHGDALADGTPLPRRFVLFYMGNGAALGRYNSTAIPGNWLPRDAGGRTIVQGADFPLSEPLKPIERVKGYMRLVSGLHAVSSRGGHHEENMSCALTGFNNKGTLENTDPRVRAKLGGPTPDFIAAKYLGGVTAVRQLRLGVCRKANSGAAIFNNLTFDDNGYPVPSEFDPQKVFDLLFRDFVPAASGTSNAPNPELLRRRSILDFVRRDAGRLKTRLGKSDAAKVDNHLTSIRELEVGLENLARPAPVSCKLPARPALSTDYPTIAKLMTNLLALAFACDRTRVASYMLTKNTSQEVLSWLGFTESFHLLSHGEYQDVIPRMTKACAWHVEQFAGLIAALAAVPEGAGTVLDNTVAVMTSENSDSQGHSQYDIPLLVAGGPRLLRGNFHFRGKGETTCNLWLGCLQALQVPINKFGDSTAPLALA
jgi:hypothetical protein